MFAYSKELVWDIFQAATSWDLTKDRWVYDLAPRIMAIQRVTLLAAGPDVFWDPDKDDDNPPRFYDPLPSGPFKGKVVDRIAVRQKVRQYFTFLGWDERGIPSQDWLRKFNVEELEQTFQKFRE